MVNCEGCGGKSLKVKEPPLKCKMCLMSFCIKCARVEPKERLLLQKSGNTWYCPGSCSRKASRAAARKAETKATDPVRVSTGVETSLDLESLGPEDHEPGHKRNRASPEAITGAGAAGHKKARENSDDEVSGEDEVGDTEHEYDVNPETVECRPSTDADKPIEVTQEMNVDLGGFTEVMSHNAEKLRKYAARKGQQNMDDGDSLVEQATVPGGSSSPLSRQEVILTGPDRGCLRGLDFLELCHELHDLCPAVVSNPRISSDFHKVHVFVQPDADISSLLETTMLCGIMFIGAKREPPVGVKRTRCKIYGVDTAISELAILRELKDHGVVEAKRITYVDNGKRTDTTKVIVVFQVEEIPGRVELGFGKHAVEILDEPRACHKCHSFSHLANACPDAERRCFNCGEGGHLRLRCPVAVPRCINCSGPHHALSNACPNKRKAMKDLAERNRRKIRSSTDSRSEEVFPLVSPKYPLNQGLDETAASYSTIVKRGVKIQMNMQTDSQVDNGPLKNSVQSDSCQPSPALGQEEISAMVEQAVADSVASAVISAVSEAVSSMKLAVEAMMAGVMSSLARMDDMQSRLASSIQSMQAQQQHLCESLPQYQSPPQFMLAQQQHPAESMPQYQVPPQFIQAQQQHLSEPILQYQAPSLFPLDRLMESQRKTDDSLKALRSRQQQLFGSA
jgi:hypothetical protein